VRQLLSHTSGVSGWERPITLEDLYDWDKSTALLAAQAPWWGPGTAPGYHALDYGHLIGEVVRRITGRRPGEFLAAHIAGPPGADFHIGLSPSGSHRVANVVPPPAAPAAAAEPVQLDPNSVAFESMSDPVMTPETTWTEGWRRADIGAANGHGHARSVARLQSAVACGGEVEGVRLLSPRTIDRTFEVQGHGIDLVIGIPSKWGLGHGLFPEGRGCAFGGHGGSLVVIDADRRMTFAHVMTKIAPGGRTIAAAPAERVSDIVKRQATRRTIRSPRHRGDLRPRGRPGAGRALRRPGGGPAPIPGPPRGPAEEPRGSRRDDRAECRGGRADPIQDG
jgi:CubicO group peptidase (beta-lactamase class C family)